MAETRHAPISGTTGEQTAVRWRCPCVDPDHRHKHTVCGRFGEYQASGACWWCSDKAAPEDHALARHMGGRPRVLPLGTPGPSFRTEQEILAYSEDRAHLVETGQLDPRASGEGRGWALVALAALRQRRDAAADRARLRHGGVGVVTGVNIVLAWRDSPSVEPMIVLSSESDNGHGLALPPADALESL